MNLNVSCEGDKISFNFTSPVNVSHVLATSHYMIGLSKERPILDHHPKAHIHEIRRISGVKSISKDQLPGMVSPMFSMLWPDPMSVGATF